MTSTELENLARTGSVKRESADQAEFEGLVRSGETRLQDALTPAYPRKAALIWCTTPPTLSHLQLFAGMASDRTAAMSYFKRSRIPSDSGLRCGVCWTRVTVSATCPSMRADCRLMSGSSTAFLRRRLYCGKPFSSWARCRHRKVNVFDQCESLSIQM